LATADEPRAAVARGVLEQHSQLEVVVSRLGIASATNGGRIGVTGALRLLAPLVEECLARGPKALVCLTPQVSWAAEVVAQLCGVPVCLSTVTPAELEALPRQLEHVSRQCGFPLAVKRALDITLAGSALLALSPVAAATALAVRLKLGRPVLFRQTRPGKHARSFAVCKFRTMSDARGVDGSLLPDAQRLGRFGRFLRTASLDELPQLLNVLRGEMSLIGPRPLMPQYLERYSNDQARRHDVLPGISGLAQVSGRNATSWSERLQLDVDYVDNWSLALDLSILLRTLRTVLGRKGISQPGHATMPEFTGNNS
jgi:lipopolysaccharide/colanic/teichoic acid biosynthesis glycosyltransferase